MATRRETHTWGVAARSLFFPSTLRHCSFYLCYPVVFSSFPLSLTHPPTISYVRFSSIPSPFFAVSCKRHECTRIVSRAISSRPYSWRRPYICELKPPNEPAALPWRPGRLPSRYRPQHKITLTICLGPLMRHICGNQFYPRATVGCWSAALSAYPFGTTTSTQRQTVLEIAHLMSSGSPLTHLTHYPFPRICPRLAAENDFGKLRYRNIRASFSDPVLIGFILREQINWGKKRTWFPCNLIAYVHIVDFVWVQLQILSLTLIVNFSYRYFFFQSIYIVIIL